MAFCVPPPRQSDPGFFRSLGISAIQNRLVTASKLGLTTYFQPIFDFSLMRTKTPQNLHFLYLRFQTALEHNFGVKTYIFGVTDLIGGIIGTLNINHSM